MSEYKCKICDGDLAYKRTREDFFEGDSVEIFNKYEKNLEDLL